MPARLANHYRQLNLAIQLLSQYAVKHDIRTRSDHTVSGLYEKLGFFAADVSVSFFSVMTQVVASRAKNGTWNHGCQKMHSVAVQPNSAIVLAVFDGLFKPSAQGMPMLNYGYGIAEKGNIFRRENRTGLVRGQNIHNEVAI
jgi:hypothetical protein